MPEHSSLRLAVGGRILTLLPTYYALPVRRLLLLYHKITPAGEMSGVVVETNPFL